MPLLRPEAESHHTRTLIPWTPPTTASDGRTPRPAGPTPGSPPRSGRRSTTRAPWSTSARAPGPTSRPPPGGHRRRGPRPLGAARPLGPGRRAVGDDAAPAPAGRRAGDPRFRGG